MSRVVRLEARRKARQHFLAARSGMPVAPSDASEASTQRPAMTARGAAWKRARGEGDENAAGMDPEREARMEARRKAREQFLEQGTPHEEAEAEEAEAAAIDAERQALAAAADALHAPPAKRPRGRPKGSKNKEGREEGTPHEVEASKRPRGRAPKGKKWDVTQGGWVDDAETVAETEAETEAETGAQALGVLRDGEAVLAVRVVQLFLLCEHTIACPLGIHLRSCRGAAIITRASEEHRRLTLWRMEKSERTSVKVGNNSS